jgi:hypothetical protein
LEDIWGRNIGFDGLPLPPFHQTMPSPCTTNWDTGESILESKLSVVSVVASRLLGLGYVLVWSHNTEEEISLGIFCLFKGLKTLDKDISLP